MISFFEENKEELNEMLGNSGRLTGISYNSDTKEFNISYKSASEVNYIGIIKPSGEITEFERATVNIEYTEVWANFFELEGKMTYTTSKDINATISWNISKPIYDYQDIPWYYDKIQNKTVSTYTDKITQVQVANDIIPESTQYMFYGLKNVSNIEGLSDLLSRINQIGVRMFARCEKLNNIEIPNSIMSIGQAAFNSCKAFTSITMSNSIKTIGISAFSNCANLTSITIPNRVTTIERNAFYYCKNLTNIIIPDSVTTIEENAFQECMSLTTITINKPADSISGAPWGAPNGVEIVQWN